MINVTVKEAGLFLCGLKVQSALTIVFTIINAALKYSYKILVTLYRSNVILPW
jgi:hypothetical protein